MTVLRPALAALLLTFPALPAVANDSVAEIGAGGLVLGRSDVIEMAEETLHLSLDRVTVDYVFRNRSDRTIETVVAFPMPDIRFGFDGDMAIPKEDDNFLGFTVTAAGAAITPQLQQQAVTDAGIDISSILQQEGLPLAPVSDPWSLDVTGVPDETLAGLERLGAIAIAEYDGKREVTPQWTLKSVYFWTMTFPAGADLAVSHTYTPAVGGSSGLYMFDGDGSVWPEYRTKYCVDDAFIAGVKRRQAALPADGSQGFTEARLSYVLHTGANWAGTIGRFRLIVDKGSPDNLVSFCGTGVTKTGPTTFELTYENFEPRGDLDVLVVQKWK